jgi:hypothetical protein
MQFRGPTLEDAIALAEQSLGARVRVVAANRIRRGGIGGFFASDLGVEVTVALDDETIEQALERLVAETAADERQQWMATAQPVAATRSADAKGAAGVPAAPAAPAPASFESLLPAAPPRQEPTTMVRVEQIIEELQHLTAAPLFGGNHTRYGGRRVVEPMPAEPPAAPAIEAVVDALADAIGVQRPVEREVAPDAGGDGAAIDPSITPALRFEPSMTVPANDRAVDAFVARARPGAAHAAAEHAPAAPAVAEDTLADAPAVAVASTDVAADVPATNEPRTLHAAAEIDLTPTARPASSSPPSRRQVELAVAATDQLMESLKREDGVKRVSVRVVLRTGDQREVEAEAEWEAS